MKKENYKRNIEVFDGIASYMSIKISRLCVQRKRESEKRACFKSVTVVNCDFTLWVTSALNGLKIDIKPINPAIRIFHDYKISHLSIYLFILKQNEAQTLRYCFMLNLLIYCQLFFDDFVFSWRNAKNLWQFVYIPRIFDISQNTIWCLYMQICGAN